MPQKRADGTEKTIYVFAASLSAGTNDIQVFSVASALVRGICASGLVFAYITAPRYQGTNSSCPKPWRSDLLGSPEAVARMSSKIFLPASCTVIDPSRIMPQLMSMSSSMRSYMVVLVASLSEGEGLQP